MFVHASALPLLPLPEPELPPGHAIQARALFPEAPKARRWPEGRWPHVDPLMRCPACRERDQLLTEYVTVCQQAEEFLAAGAPLPSDRASLLRRAMVALEAGGTDATEALKLILEALNAPAPPSPAQPVNLIDADALFPRVPVSLTPMESGPMPLLEPLLRSAPSTERDRLVARYLDVSERAEAYHTAILPALRERRRMETYAECREAEDAVKRLEADLGRLNARANVQAGIVNDARRAALAANARPFQTRFPTDSELAAWSQSKATARAALEAAEGEQAQVRVLHTTARWEHEAALTRLGELTDALAAIDQEVL